MFFTPPVSFADTSARLRGYMFIKDRLWILNSSIIVFFIGAFITYFALQQEIPLYHAVSRPFETNEQPTPLPFMVNLETIYKNDLFDTYVPPQAKAPQKKNLVTPLPPLTFKTPPPPPAPKPVSFIPPLSLTLRGIIVAEGKEDENIVIAADQTGKEETYRVGDKIQDAHIIKITRNKMVILRSNGQQESHFLRKEEELNKEGAQWDRCIRKAGEYIYEVDPTLFTHEVTSVGELIEHLELGTVYENGTPRGVRVNSMQSPLMLALGLQHGDIITDINGMQTADRKSRVAIFDHIGTLAEQEVIALRCTRHATSLLLTYRLTSFSKQPSLTSLDQMKDMTEEELFKVDKATKRHLEQEQFEKRHKTAEKRQQALEEMRAQLVSEMSHRAPHRKRT